MSDGEDTCAPPDPCQVARDLKAQGVTLTIQTIGFQVDQGARRQLECIAQATGGTYTDAKDAAQLTESLKVTSGRALRTLQTQGGRVEGTPPYRDAPLLEPGRYTDTMVPNESLWWGVPLRFGQQLTVKATVDRPGETTRLGSFFEVQLVNPDLDELCCNIGRGSDVNLTERVVSIGTTSGLIDRASKEPDLRVEGTYYVRLTYTARDEGQQERPVELSIEVTGASSTTTTAAAATTPATTDEVAAAPAGTSTGSASTALLVALLGVGALIVVLLVVLIVTLRRRPTGTPPA